MKPTLEATLIFASLIAAPAAGCLLSYKTRPHFAPWLLGTFVVWLLSATDPSDPLDSLGWIALAVLFTVASYAGAVAARKSEPRAILVHASMLAVLLALAGLAFLGGIKG